MLLIDHQSGLFQTVGDMDMTVLRTHVIALAKIATLSKIPVITRASVLAGPHGPLIPEIHENAPHLNAHRQSDGSASTTGGRRQMSRPEISGTTVNSLCPLLVSVRHC
ncbi:MAG TPA: hypothetical protein VE959_17615 [Bryobacteraceae bacterium]|nr:hypothetical protein [Bryobacteraceae bacterium]